MRYLGHRDDQASKWSRRTPSTPSKGRRKTHTPNTNETVLTWDLTRTQQHVAREQIIDHWNRTGGDGDKIEDIKQWAANLLLTEGYSQAELHELFEGRGQDSIGENLSWDTAYEDWVADRPSAQQKMDWIIASILSHCKEQIHRRLTAPVICLAKREPVQQPVQEPGNREHSRGREHFKKKGRRREGYDSQRRRQGLLSPHWKRRSPAAATPANDSGPANDSQTERTPVASLGRGRSPAAATPANDSQTERTPVASLGRGRSPAAANPANDSQTERTPVASLGRGRSPAAATPANDSQTERTPVASLGRGRSPAAATPAGQTTGQVKEEAMDDQDPGETSSEEKGTEPRAKKNLFATIIKRRARWRGTTTNVTTKSKRSSVEQIRRRLKEEEEPTVFSESFDITTDTMEDSSVISGMEPILWSGTDTRIKEEPGDSPGCSREMSGMMGRPGYSGEFLAPCIDHPWRGGQPRSSSTMIKEAGVSQPEYAGRCPVYKAHFPQIMRDLGLHQEEDGSEVTMHILMDTRPDLDGSTRLAAARDTCLIVSPETSQGSMMSKMKKCTVRIARSVSLGTAEGVTTRSRRRQLDREQEARLVLLTQREGEGILSDRTVKQILMISAAPGAAVQRTTMPLTFGGQDVFVSMPLAMSPRGGIRRFFCEVDPRMVQIAFDLRCLVGDVARVPFYPAPRGIRGENRAEHALYFIFDRVTWNDPCNFEAFEKGLRLVIADAVKRRIHHLATVNPPRTAETGSAQQVERFFEERFAQTGLVLLLYGAS